MPDPYKEMRDIWNDLNHRQEFEHELISRKEGWLLTGQTLLFAAYGLTFRDGDDRSAEHFRTIVSWAGLLVATVVLLGVSAIIVSKFLSYRQYRRFYEPPRAEGAILPRPFTGERLQWGVWTPNTFVTLSPDVLLPLIFIGAWIALLTS